MEYVFYFLIGMAIIDWLFDSSQRSSDKAYG